MNQYTRAAIEEKIRAIETDPLAWAKADHEKFSRTMGSAALYATSPSDAELLARAAMELVKARKLLAEATIESIEPVDTPRLLRANERTRRAVENLES